MTPDPFLLLKKLALTLNILNELTNRQNISDILEEVRRQMGELDRRIVRLWELGGGRGLPPAGDDLFDIFFPLSEGESWGEENKSTSYV